MLLRKTFGILFVGLALVANSQADEDTQQGEPDSVIIPLDQIWALDMLGTRHTNELFQDDYGKVDKDTDEAHQRLLTGIRKMLAQKRPGKKAMAGFVVNAEGRRNLVALASDGIGYGEPLFGAPDGVLRRKPYFDSNSFFSSNKLCVIFFSYASDYHVELEQAERRGTVIDIRYRFVPHDSGKSNGQLAIIPFGKLEAGEYQVAISQSTMQQKYLDAGYERVSEEQAKHIVCQPFSFQVWNPPTPDIGLGKDAVEIPLDQIWGSIPGMRNINELENNPLNENSLMGEISEILSNRVREKTDPAFVVVETGLEGLKNAHDVIVKRKPPLTFLIEGREASIVFFTHTSGYHVHLVRVEIEGNTIRVRYKLTPRQYLAQDFALIPIGKLPKGEYKVDMIPEPMAKRFPEDRIREVNVERRSRIICSSFEFKVI